MKLKYMTLTALATSLIFVTTIMLQIPNGIGGYIHLGDGLLLVFSILLPSRYAFFAASIGSALADLASGYSLYILPTFIIKGWMSLCFYHHQNSTKRIMLGYLSSCILLIGGYFITDFILYQSFSIAALSILPNLLQGGCGCILSFLLYPILMKSLRSFHKMVTY